MQWGPQMYGRVYKCIGGMEIYGHVLMNGAYRCIGVYRCREVYRCMGECRDVWHIQTYGGCTGAYRCMDAYRCMWVYRCMGGIQTYGGCMETYRGMEDIQIYGDHTDTPRHPDSLIYPPHSCQLHLGTIFLTKFKLVPYRHILLAHQLA